MLGISHHDLRRQFDRITVRIDTVAQLCKELEVPDEITPDPKPVAPLYRSRHRRGRALLASSPSARDI
jgi:hypothetical protein